MGRATLWQHPDGPSATIAALEAALRPHVLRLVDSNLQVYSSDDYKAGVNHNLMRDSVDMLESLVELDTRGGLFGQGALTQALTMCIENAGMKEELIAKTLSEHKPVTEVLALMAYRIRVMLAHLRAKFDSANNGAPEGFERLYELLEKPTPAPTTRRMRRGERIGSRPNPFVNFRAKGEAEMREEEDDATPVIVSKYFDGRRACALRDDGNIEFADTYTPTETGFVRAQWLVEGVYLDLEIPNTCCRDGVLVFETPAPSVLKRPAQAKAPVPEEANESASEVPEEDEPEVAEQQEECDDGEVKQEAPKKRRVATPATTDTTAFLRLVPGHGTKMTIVARSSSTDKAQLLEITSGACEGTGYTPTTACQAVIEAMQQEATEVLSVPVAKHPSLRALRLKARACRRALLGRATT